ncbi:hypothetical protein BaRGS_00015769 [Batillaria attramentaria]|uniref:Uncharacterized protein n=1 Tax=Batillaria attramentaria TaxID=370345 RepID=A0ABD0L0U4_9CAEN
MPSCVFSVSNLSLAPQPVCADCTGHWSSDCLCRGQDVKHLTGVRLKGRVRTGGATIIRVSGDYGSRRAQQGMALAGRRRSRLLSGTSHCHADHYRASGGSWPSQVKHSIL